MLKSYWWVFLCAAGIGWFVGNLAAGLVSFQMPKLFESAAVIQVSQSSNGNRSEGAGFKEVSSAEIIRILTDISVPSVVDRLKREKHVQFPRTVTLENLRNAVTCEPLEKPGLISIKARLPGKFDARDAVTFLLDSLEMAINRPSAANRIKWKSLEDELDGLRREKADLLNRIDQHHGSPYRSTAAASPANEEIDLGQSLRKNLETTENRISELTEEAYRFREELKSKKMTVTIVSKPLVSDRPVSPDLDFNFSIGRIAGLVLSQVICLFALRFFRRDGAPSAA